MKRQQRGMPAMRLMAALGVGFSLPLGAILFGVAFEKVSALTRKTEAGRGRAAFGVSKERVSPA